MEQPEEKEVSKTVFASGNDALAPVASEARKYLPRAMAFAKRSRENDSKRTDSRRRPCPM